MNEDKPYKVIINSLYDLFDIDVGDALMMAELKAIRDMQTDTSSDLSDVKDSKKLIKACNVLGEYIGGSEWKS